MHSQPDNPSGVKIVKSTSDIVPSQPFSGPSMLPLLLCAVQCCKQGHWYQQLFRCKFESEHAECPQGLALSGTSRRMEPRAASTTLSTPKADSSRSLFCLTTSDALSCALAPSPCTPAEQLTELA